MRKTSVTMITQAAIIAALYVVLTLIANSLGLANGPIQVRFSEALCVLPYFTFAAVPGLYVGCFIVNILTGAAIWDVIFGSLATLIGAIGTYLLRKNRVLLTLPPVIANMVIIPLVICFGYGIDWRFDDINLAYPYFVVTVGIGEAISVCVLGSILLKLLLPYKSVLFRDESR